MRSLLVLASLTLLSCQASASPQPPAPQAPSAPRASSAAIVAAPDCSAKDRELDAGRHPVELLDFLALSPGMKAANLGAGPGHTTELMVRAVSPGGVVYMQNEPTWLPFLQEALRERFTHQVMVSGVVRAERPFEDPLPPDARGLDLVVMNLIYHDVVNTKTDRAKMNANVFAALRPGGAYVVIDSSAPAHSGLQATATLHRIDEDVVKEEVSRAGFKLVAEGSFLRNPEDTRDWDSSPGAATKVGRRGKSDRFVLRFARP